MVDLLRPRGPGARRTLRVGLAVLGGVVLVAGCAAGGSREDDAGPRPSDGADVAGDAARAAASDRQVARGREALARGDLGEAAARLERAIRIDPSNGRAYVALAEVRLAADRPGDARGLLERALGLLEADTRAAARADSLLRALPPAPE